MFFGKTLSHIKNILFVFPTLDLWLTHMVHTCSGKNSIDNLLCMRTTTGLTLKSIMFQESLASNN